MRVAVQRHSLPVVIIPDAKGTFIEGKMYCVRTEKRLYRFPVRIILAVEEEL